MNHSSWTDCGPLLVFINKVLLGHSYTHLFTYCVWLLSYSHGFHSASPDGEHKLQNLIVTVFSFMEKFATPLFVSITKT